MMMKHLNRMGKLMGLIALAVIALSGSHVKAQTLDLEGFTEVFRDTVDYNAPTETVVTTENFDPYRVVTNKFGKNWFVFATGGYHSFRGDYSNTGKFSGTLSPDFGIGFGKWFTPGIALKVEWIRGDSKGYTEYLTGHYGHGDIMLTPDNTPYRKMKTSWWDISGSVIFNLTRLFLGYEGVDSPKRMNQFFVNLGLGGVHHLGYAHKHGSDNEWAGHVEFQYSRFFTKSKRFSIDLKARGIFYQTNFDLEYGQHDYKSSKWDCNLGIDLGFTWYMGKKRANGWQSGATQLYQRDFRERKITIYNEKESAVDYGTLTFYVFYPNNYSGRNDAPTVAGAPVNSIDYLAGGLYTQKRFNDNGDAASRILSGASLKGLKASDIPTEVATVDFDVDYVPRGYELSTEPLSLSLNPSDMSSFREKAGFYYAPIYDGNNTWQYRVDDATLGQTLLSKENYQETASYGLNSHNGIPLVAEHLGIADGDMLVSFADVYAAMNGNEGYISKYTDAATVAKIKDILDNGQIAMIQTEGLATSQDNYTGADASKVGAERNLALSQNRALSVVNWLKGKKELNEVASQIFMVNAFDEGPVRKVDDKSTRGLDAKLNRCVKVRVHYLLPDKKK